MDALIQTLEDDLRAFQAQAYLCIAGFCLILYDILITWDVEITLVWPAPVSFVKVLFLWNRYVMPGIYVWNVYIMSGLVAGVHDNSVSGSCFNFLLVDLVFQAICTNFVGATLMMMRVYALYNRDKRVLAVLCALLVVECGTTFGASLYAVVYHRAEIVFVDLLGTCAASTLTINLSWLWLVFLLMIIFDITVFALVLSKTWEHVRVTQIRTSLLTVMLLDGVWYFLVMLAAEFVNLVAFATFPSNMFLVGMNIMWCVNTMMVSRLYLNLRSAARPQDWSELTAFKTMDTDESLDAPSSRRRRSLSSC